MKITRNKYLARFGSSGLFAPEQWGSKQAQRLFDAGISAERDGSWSDHAASGSVRVAYKPRLPELSPYGTSQDAARTHVERHIAKMRREADMMEKTLKAYGPSAFIERPEAVECPAQPAAAEPFLASVLRSGWTRIWIAGVEFTRDPSGAAVRA